MLNTFTFQFSFLLKRSLTDWAFQLPPPLLISNFFFFPPPLLSTSEILFRKQELILVRKR